MFIHVMSEWSKKGWALLNSSDPSGERAREHVSFHSADKRLIAAQQMSCCSDLQPKGHTVAAQSFMRTAESSVRFLCFFMFNSSFDMWLFVLPLSERSEITRLWLWFVDREHLRFHLDFLWVVLRLIPEPEVPLISCKLLDYSHQSDFIFNALLSDGFSVSADKHLCRSSH